MSDLKVPDLNRVELVGRLTREVEVTHTKGGMEIGKMGLAVSRKYKLKSGELQEETLFINVTVWGKTALYCGEHMTKGTPVLVEGRLTMSEWEDKKTGDKRTSIEVNGDRIQNLAWEEMQAKNAPDSRGNRPQRKREVAEPDVSEDEIPY